MGIRGFESLPLRQLQTLPVRAFQSPQPSRPGPTGRGSAVSSGRAAARVLPLPACLLALAVASCAATRTLDIRSDPPGAEVRIDQQPVGKTPLVWEFYDYGTHQLTFHLEGHRSAARIVTLVAPWKARFPLDIATEVLVPIGWSDRHELSVRLEAGTEVMEQPDLRLVLERAQWLRTAGPAGPGPAVVTNVPLVESTGSATPAPAPAPTPPPPPQEPR
ncbi:MAG: PEGA domain-containing protein [Planctomycetota bacterium]|nr:MAG: PEGA domain-containing protein [Planctomycetota bacterium]